MMRKSTILLSIAALLVALWISFSGASLADAADPSGSDGVNPSGTSGTDPSGDSGADPGGTGDASSGDSGSWGSLTSAQSQAFDAQMVRFGLDPG